MKSTTTRLRIALGIIGVVVSMFLFAYPTQSMMAQQHRVDKAQQQLDELNRRNRELAVIAQRLATPSEIARQARERFNMVKPKEKAYSVVERPKPAPTTIAGATANLSLIHI